jgi:prepilin peptidase CpaA
MADACVLLALAATAGAWDLCRRRIPNALTYPAALTGFAIAACGAGATSTADSVLGAAAALICGAPLFLAGGMGGGDVKLLAAIGALVGPAGLMHTALLALIIGSAASIVWLGWRRELSRTARSVAVFFATALTPRVPVILPRGGPRLRFGVCIALAAAAQAGWGPG